MHGPSRAINQPSWAEMSNIKNDPDAGQSVDSSQASQTTENGHDVIRNYELRITSGDSNGNGSGNKAIYSTAPLPTIDGATGGYSNVNGHKTNGQSASIGNGAPANTVRPV